MADDKTTSTTPPAPEPSKTEPTRPTTKQLTCPTCGSVLDLYEGTNPSKIGTGFCTKCGVRHSLKG